MADIVKFDLPFDFEAVSTSSQLVNQTLLRGTALMTHGTQNKASEAFLAPH